LGTFLFQILYWTFNIEVTHGLVYTDIVYVLMKKLYWGCWFNLGQALTVNEFLSQYEELTNKVLRDNSYWQELYIY